MVKYNYKLISKIATLKDMRLSDIADKLGQNQSYFYRTMGDAKKGVDMSKRLDKHMPQIAEILGVDISEFYADELQGADIQVTGLGNFANDTVVAVNSKVSNSNNTGEDIQAKAEKQIAKLQKAMKEGDNVSFKAELKDFKDFMQHMEIKLNEIKESLAEVRELNEILKKEDKNG